MSIEGGVRGNQRRLVCPNCGKVFFAWRPDELPGQKIKCYFCRHEFADEAAMRQPPTPLPAPPASPATPTTTTEALPVDAAATATPTTATEAPPVDAAATATPTTATEPPPAERAS